MNISILDIVKLQMVDKIACKAPEVQKKAAIRKCVIFNSIPLIIKPIFTATPIFSRGLKINCEIRSVEN